MSSKDIRHTIMALCWLIVGLTLLFSVITHTIEPISTLWAIGSIVVLKYLWGAPDEAS